MSEEKLSPVPRMRTIPEALREIQAADPNTAMTLRALGAAGVIKRDCNNSNTCVVRLGDGVQRAIVVIEGCDTNANPLYKRRV